MPPRPLPKVLPMPRPARDLPTPRPLAAAVLAACLVAGSATAQSNDEGPSQISETYRDWRVICVAAEDGTGTAGRQCEMSQQLTLTETGQRVLSLAVQRQPDGAPRATFVAPFGLRLADGLVIEVNGAAVQAMGFLTCMPDGCIAAALLEDATMAALRAGTSADIRLTALSGETLAPQVSLLGFTAAWNRLAVLAAD